MNNLFLGEAITFSGVKQPFTVAELLTSGAGLVFWIAGFVLLGLAFVMAQQLIIFIKNASQSHQSRQLDRQNQRIHDRKYGKGTGRWDQP